MARVPLLLSIVVLSCSGSSSESEHAKKDASSDVQDDSVLHEGSRARSQLLFGTERHLELGYLAMFTAA